ncbi:MAG TPA: trigger factor [Candidatus Hydrogenedentes bacterium]|nr:trigger factor [Candidatus Hydrogenedentota bacterium]HOL77542.1 trigger factor [Candidatus Hydrogenedentota bacterium]
MTDNESKPTTDSEHEDNSTADVATAEHTHAHGEETEEFQFVEDPSFDVSYKGDCAYEVKVVIPAANEEKQTTELFDELKHEATVPGFRKGRAPIKLIQKKFEKYVRSEVESRLISEAFRKLVKEQDLHPVTTPDIEGIDKDQVRQPGEPISVTLKFEVAPRVTLGKYRGIELTREVRKVCDKEVEEALENLRNRYAVYEPLNEGSAQAGDQVVIDFTGTVDGEPFRGGTAQNYPYILGTQRFFQEFEDVLSGAQVGAELECSVALPQDYFNEELRGKTAKFQIRVKELRRKKMPELNDEFAKSVGYESVDELRKAVRDRLAQEYQNQSQAELENQALEKVISASTFEIPKSVLDSTTEDYYQEEVRNLLRNRVPIETVEQRAEEIRNRAREMALRDVKAFVALNEIAEAEGLTVSDDDMEEHLEATSARMGIALDKLMQYVGEDEDRRSSYASRILRVKALKVIIDNANIVDQEVTEDQSK